MLGTRHLLTPETENLSPNTKILIPFSLNFKAFNTSVDPFSDAKIRDDPRFFPGDSYVTRHLGWIFKL